VDPFIKKFLIGLAVVLGVTGTWVTWIVYESVTACTRMFTC